MKWQVTEIFKEIKEIGNSKYEAKNNARQAGAHGSAEIAKKTGIYSYRTNDAYRESVIAFGKWAKENLNLKDLTQTTAEAAKAYLYYRIENKVSHKTFQSNKASLNKFQVALNTYSKSHNLNRIYDFKLNGSFKYAHKNLQHANVKAYDEKTINKLLNIDSKAVNLSIRLALGGGLRKSETLKLTVNDLQDNKIQILGGKGGKDRIVSVIHDKTIINDLKNYLQTENIKNLGQVLTGAKINYEISKATGGSGSEHKLRHNYSINTQKGFKDKAYSHIEAVHLTSKQLGHNRNEIVEGVYSK